MKKDQVIRVKSPATKYEQLSSGKTEVTIMLVLFVGWVHSSACCIVNVHTESDPLTKPHHDFFFLSHIGFSATSSRVITGQH